MPVRLAPFVPEDLALVEMAVAVGVLEDQDPVLALGLGPPVGVGVVLGDPEPASGVDRERDRLADVGLAREERDLEPSGTVIFVAASDGGTGPSARPTVAQPRSRSDAMSQLVMHSHR